LICITKELAYVQPFRQQLPAEMTSREPSAVFVNSREVRDQSPMELRVEQVELLTPVIKQFRLVAADASTRLPGYEAGAHISMEVRLEGRISDWRRYSLVDFECANSRLDGAPAYTVAVRLDDRSRGGSQYLHTSVATGDAIRVLPPRNDFHMVATAGPALLIAGGIGVTPLASMAAAAAARRQPVRMFLAGRNRESLAYVEPLKLLMGDRLHLHVDEEAKAPPDIACVLATAEPASHIYVCGPQPMLDAVLAGAGALGIDSGRIHFEMFAPPKSALADREFEVVLARSGRVLRVPQGKTLLAVLNEANCDVLYDCERGECGVCRVDVLEGAVDHRDYAQTEREKAEGRVMHTCVSRSLSDRLVLDL
jgi:ferredoxin-NADP reductase